jgi:hypothetical protein
MQWGALVELRDEGKIRHIRLSGATLEMLERAQRLTPLAAVQNRFNMIDRSGIEVLAACGTSPRAVRRHPPGFRDPAKEEPQGDFAVRLIEAIGYCASRG